MNLIITVSAYTARLMLPPGQLAGIKGLLPGSDRGVLY